MKKTNYKKKGKRVSTKRIIVIAISIMLVAAITIQFGRYIINRNEASAQENCYVYKDNKRILCFASSSTVMGVRYANKFSRDNYSTMWGVTIHPNALFGHNEKNWLDYDSKRNNLNFLDCSGYVNVVMYLALFGGTQGRAAGSQYYVNNNNYTRINDQSKLQAGDLLIRNERSGQIGHVAIFGNYSSSKEGAALSTYEATATPDSSGKAVSGIRSREQKTDYQAGYFDYALRFRHGLFR